jgi:hypothetical protein
MILKENVKYSGVIFIFIIFIISYFNYNHIEEEGQKEFDLLKHPSNATYINYENMRYYFSSTEKSEFIKAFYDVQLIQNGWKFSGLNKQFGHPSKGNPEGGNYYLYTKGNLLLILGCDLAIHKDSYYIEYAKSK